MQHPLTECHYTQQQLCLAYPSFAFYFRAKTENHSLSIITRHRVQTVNTEGVFEELEWKGLLSLLLKHPRLWSDWSCTCGMYFDKFTPEILNQGQGNIPKGMSVEYARRALLEKQNKGKCSGLVEKVPASFCIFYNTHWCFWAKVKCCIKQVGLPLAHKSILSHNSPNYTSKSKIW